MTQASHDPCRLNADLHCHSRFSDGVLEPAELVKRAHENGVQIFALTDHDEIGGIAQAREVAAQCQLPFVAGVEISVTWSKKTIHIVGLGIDTLNEPLVKALESLREGRDNRARAMAQSLSDQAGIHHAYEGALGYVSNPSLVSRTHFARYLVAQGVCSSTHDVFSRFLVEGRPGFVPHDWARLSDAVRWISDAGGQAVIAHPGRYRLNETQLWALLCEFREAGGHAIEVITGSHTRDQYSRFATIAREHDFAASRGSDFHSPDESRVDLGELPLLPDSVVPIWHDWSMQ